nr:S8 family serine peptidase [Oharaeibacter diazotrophicus]
MAIKRSRYAPGFSVTVTAAELAELAADPAVTAIQLEQVFSPTLDASLPRIGAPAAIAAGADGRNTAVAVIDTGVDLDHPFLRGKVTLKQACFSSNIPFVMSSLCPSGGDTEIATGAGDDCGPLVSGCFHGTHVAGIVAGVNRTATGPRRGVAPGAKILPIMAGSMVVDCGNERAPCVRFNGLDLLDALGFVIERVNRADLPGTPIAAVNMSLGGGRNTGDCDLVNGLMKAQIDALRSRGVATVIASGNDGFTDAVGSPACISSAVTVGSTDTATDRVSVFSNMNRMVDLLAPGSVIQSSVPGGGFAGLQGTSMATPHVAAAFAAIKSVEPTATVARIEAALKATGRPIRDTRPGGTLIRSRIELDDAAAKVRAENPDLSAAPTARQILTKSSLTSFSPAGRSFTIRATGSRLGFEVRDVPVFLETSVGSGSIAAGSSTRITVRPSAAAFFLPAGTYDGNIKVVNRDAIGDVATLRVRLVVR